MAALTVSLAMRGHMLRRALAGVMVAGLILVAPGNLDAQKRSRDVIKRQEIVENMTKEHDLFTAIQRLRPHFFQGSGARTLGGGRIYPLRIYLGNIELPDIHALKNTMAFDVEEVRYLSPSAAEARFGGQANGGAIVIKMDLKLPKKDSTPP
jgi:hypothetical protein